MAKRRKKRRGGGLLGGTSRKKRGGFWGSKKGKGLNTLKRLQKPWKK